METVRQETTDFSDEELMLRVSRSDDQPAFAELVRRFSPELTGYLRRFSDANAADDLAQLTILNVHEKRHQYHPGRLVRPWLYGIATHLAIDAWRKSQRRRESSLESVSGGALEQPSRREWASDEDIAPDETAADREMCARVRAAVTALPEHLRSVVMLVQFQGLKYAEAAEALQVPIGTIKSRLYQARKRLQKQLPLQAID